jgi:hypothetical protein
MLGSSQVPDQATQHGRLSSLRRLIWPTCLETSPSRSGLACRRFNGQSTVPNAHVTGLQFTVDKPRTPGRWEDLVSPRAICLGGRCSWGSRCPFPTRSASIPDTPSPFQAILFGKRRRFGRGGATVPSRVMTRDHSATGENSPGLAASDDSASPPDLTTRSEEEPTSANCHVHQLRNFIPRFYGLAGTIPR